MKEIKLTRNHVALVDDCDFDILNQFKWHFDGRYAARTVWNKELGKESKVYMHKIIMENEPCPENARFVDHVNSEKLDNRRENLRFVSFKQNSQNQSTQIRDKHSSYKGVSWDKTRNKWIAYIKKDKKSYHLGRYECEKQAALAYNEKAVELFGEYAKSNIID